MSSIKLGPLSKERVSIYSLAFIGVLLTLFPKFDTPSNMIFTSGLEILFCGLSFFLLKTIPRPSKRATLLSLFSIISLTTSLAYAYFGYFWHYDKLIRFLQIVISLPFFFFASIAISRMKQPYILFLAIVFPCLFLCFNQFQHLFAHLSDNRYYSIRAYYFEHIRHLGHYLLICLVICLCTFAFSKKTIAQYSGLLLSLILWLMLFWLGGRYSILIASLILIIIMSLLFLRKENNILKKNLFLVITPCAGFGLHHFIKAFNTGQKPDTDMLTRTLNATNLNSLGSGRIGMWENAYSLFKQNILLGAGPDAYSKDINSYGFHAHGIIPQFLCEFGLLGGGIILITLAYWSVTLFIKMYRDNHFQTDFFSLTAYLSLLSLLLNSLLSGTYYFALPVYYISLFFAIIYGRHLAQTNSLKGS